MQERPAVTTTDAIDPMITKDETHNNNSEDMKMYQPAIATAVAHVVFEATRFIVLQLLTVVLPALVEAVLALAYVLVEVLVSRIISTLLFTAEENEQPSVAEFPLCNDDDASRHTPPPRGVASKTDRPLPMMKTNEVPPVPFHTPELPPVRSCKKPCTPSTPDKSSNTTPAAAGVWNAANSASEATARPGAVIVDEKNAVPMLQQESPQQRMIITKPVDQQQQRRRVPLASNDTPTTGILLGKHSCPSQDGATATADSSPRPRKTRRSDDQGVSDRHDLRPKPTNTKAIRNSPVVAVKRKYKTYTSDLIVVLDLDECLIHAKLFTDPFTASSYAHQVQNTAAKKTSVTETSGPVESFRVQVDRKCYAHVNLRPGVLDFLQHITSTYETHIYTAATRVYADAVLDYLVTHLGGHSSSSSSCSADDLFAGRWYRQHCAHDVARGAYVKDLSRLPVPLHRTVLVDNNPLSFLSQPQNGILVNAFYDDGDDRTLNTVARFIATYLAPAAVDVRAVLVYGPCPMETFASHKNKQSVLASEELLN
jgi:Dullard-like phosphatase family protein